MYQLAIWFFLIVHAQVCALRLYAKKDKAGGKEGVKLEAVKQEAEDQPEIAWVTSFDAEKRVGSFWKSYTHFWPPSFGKLHIIAENNEAGKKIVDCVSHFPREGFGQFVNASFVTTTEKGAWLRKQLWKFFLDKYTTAPVIAVFDDDACLFTQVVRRHLVEDGKLINRGLRMEGVEANGRWKKATEFVLGKKQVADFMTDFPVLLWRDMLPELRSHIINRFKDEAAIDTNLPEEAQLSRALHFISTHAQLSEFNLMMNYAWNTPSWKDRYQWHFAPSQDLMPGYKAGEVKPIPAFSLHNHQRGCPTRELDTELKKNYHVYPGNMQMSFPEGTTLVKPVDWLGKVGHSWGVDQTNLDALLADYFEKSKSSIHPFLETVQADIKEMKANKISLSILEQQPDADEFFGKCFP